MDNNQEFSNKRILVVEDYLINQELTKELLEILGCTVDVASTGHEALELVEKQRYDLIFMDIQMPKMDGYETTKEIRQLEKGSHHTPIVALTANALQGDREKCINAGMDDYISKPFRSSDLERVLSQWLEKTKT